MALPARHGVPEPVNAFSSPDRALGVSADRVKILQGQMFGPRRGRPGGDRPAAGQPRSTCGPAARCTCSGSLNNPQTVMPELATGRSRWLSGSPRSSSSTPRSSPPTPTSAQPLALLSPPFTATRAARSIYNYGNAGRGAAAAGREHDRDSCAPPAPSRSGTRPPAGRSLSSACPTRLPATERAIRPQAVALAMFAVLAGLIGLAVIGQLLARQLVLDSAEFPILRALGMTRASLAALSPGPAGRGDRGGGRHRGRGGHRGLAADADRAGPAGRAAARASRSTWPCWGWGWP